MLPTPARTCKQRESPALTLGVELVAVVPVLAHLYTDDGARDEQAVCCEWRHSQPAARAGSRRRRESQHIGVCRQKADG